MLFCPKPLLTRKEEIILIISSLSQLYIKKDCLVELSKYSRNDMWPSYLHILRMASVLEVKYLSKLLEISF